MVCWYAVLGVAWSFLSNFADLVMDWTLLLVVVEVLFVGFGATALLATGHDLETRGPPDS